MVEREMIENEVVNRSNITAQERFEQGVSKHGA